MKRPKKRTVETDDAVLLEAYATNRSIRLVAAQFGLSRMTVARRIRSAPSEMWDKAAQSILEGKAAAILYCFVLDCEQRVFGHNIYCPKHQLRQQRHGDPLIVHKRGRKKRASP